MIGLQCQLGFVGDLFSYQKAPFENFCDLPFCHKSRHREFFISCLSWEIKIDMSGQSKDGLRVFNVKIGNSSDSVESVESKADHGKTRIFQCFTCITFHLHGFNCCISKLMSSCLL